MEEAESTLTRDGQLFRDVFNSSPIGIAAETLEGQLLFVNSALCSMLGFSEEELCSKHCVDFSPPEDAVKDWARFQELRAGSIDQYQLEKRYFRRDGSLLWGNLSISLLKSRPSPACPRDGAGYYGKEDGGRGVAQAKSHFGGAGLFAASA